MKIRLVTFYMKPTYVAVKFSAITQNSPIVCVAVALHSGNYHSGEQGPTVQNIRQPNISARLNNLLYTAQEYK